MEKLPVVVVSGFDGLSGGRIAFDRVEHIDVLRYYSSEVDKYAIQVADHNYPQDTPYRLGDITKLDGHKLLKEIREEFGDVKIILIGGSPCQGFSMAGKLQGSSTACGIDVVSLEQYMDLKAQNFEFNGQSYLFWEFVRLQKEIQPDYFFLENVKINPKWLPMFNQAMGVEPLRIDSEEVCAGMRKRFYWTNIQDIKPIKQKDVKLQDILDNAYTDREKSFCIDANYGKGSNLRRYLYRGSRQIVFTDEEFMKSVTGENKPHIDKCNLIGKENRDKWRFLTPEECEKTQTLPVGFTLGVPKFWRYHMIGNGWTIDVPAHIFRHIPLELDTNQE